MLNEGEIGYTSRYKDVERMLIIFENVWGNKMDGTYSRSGNMASV